MSSAWLRLSRFCGYRSASMLGLLALLLVVLPGCGSGAATSRALAGPPVTANPDTQLFVEPEDGAEPIVNELNAANQSIDAVVYLLSAREIISALENAPKRGVRVRTMLEEHPVGEGPGNAGVYKRLQRAGVSVRWASPRFKLTHEKAIVIDGREALILTLNLTASAFTRNREYGVVDRTPEDVAETEALFSADWDRHGYQPVRPDLVVSPENSRPRLAAIIDQAARDLDVESEEVQDAAVEDALAAASHRGVRVRVVVSPPESGANGNAKGIDRLKAGGVQVHLLRKPYVHAKTFIADGTAAFVGSENISTQSLDANRELGIFISQPSALARLHSTFEQDWNARG